MTYLVVSSRRSGERETVVGTIWAEGEQQAKAIASMVCSAKPDESLTLRPGEPREIPLKLPN